MQIRLCYSFSRPWRERSRKCACRSPEIGTTGPAQKHAVENACTRPRYKSGARPGDSQKARRSVPGGNLRAGPQKSIPVADLDDPLGAMHGRPRERSHSQAVPQISQSRSVCLREPQRARKRHSPHRLFSQQDEIDHGRQQENHRRVSRRGSQNDGGAPDASRRRAENRQRRARHSVRDRLRSSRRYARATAFRAASISPKIPTRRKSSRI